MSYLDHRDDEIDTTEWIDIYTALKALNPKRNEVIVELCAGKGYLMHFLSRKLGNEVVGVDLEGCKYNNKVICMDLSKEDPPIGDIYVFQHCIEHIPQLRARNILKQALTHGRAVIGILPGHKVDDPTHIVNHYHLDDIMDIVRYVNPPYFIVRPDIRSYAYPASLDYLLVMSKTPVKKVDTIPARLALAVWLYRKLLSDTLTPVIAGWG